MFQNFKDCLFNNKNAIDHKKDLKDRIMMFIQIEVNKIALWSNDDKRLQTSDRIKTYPYGTNAFKVCESEMLMLKRFIL